MIRGKEDKALPRDCKERKSPLIGKDGLCFGRREVALESKGAAEPELWEKLLSNVELWPMAMVWWGLTTSIVLLMLSV